LPSPGSAPHRLQAEVGDHLWHADVSRDPAGVVPIWAEESPHLIHQPLLQYAIHAVTDGPAEDRLVGVHPEKVALVAAVAVLQRLQVPVQPVGHDSDVAPREDWCRPPRARSWPRHSPRWGTHRR
jgi:hypothetical protein